MSRSLALALAFAFGSAFAADGPESANVRGESTTTRKRLAEAEQKLLAGQSADALDELLRILDDAGDDLVTADGKQFTSARQYAHRFLAKLPEAALRRYRDRVEEPAAKLLARGRTLRDGENLQQLLDRYAVSRPAEDAILLLADLAFERGEFGSAERYWRSLLPDSDPKYPSPRAKPADIEAKVIAATIFRGDRVAAGPMLEGFAKRHPNAAGRVAGRTGPYLATLVALANDRPAGRLPEASGGWTTLGGMASRDGRVGGSLPRHWPARPTWTVPIPAALAGWRGRAGRPPSVGAVKALAFHPVVIDRSAYVADAGRVFAIDLRSGAIRLVFDATRIDRPRLPASALGVPSPVDADFALTAADGRLYFRFGESAIFPSAEDGEPVNDRPSLLIALAPPVGAEPAAVVWRRFPPVPDGVPASWEGAPIVADGTVYAAFVRSDGGRTIHAIARYRGDSDRPDWVADICETGAAETRTRHELLTLAGRNVVFCSHSGIVAAVNAQSGKPVWAYRYPRIRRYAADGRHRDLSPAVHADGRVFVAPNDADHLYAFDADSGAPLWSDGPILFDHLIGAANGKVVAAIAGPQRGLRAYDAATGSCDFPRGWRNHDDPFLTTFGRGLLNDEFILWPTAAALYTIRLVDGTIAAQPARGPHGNLAYANGTLLVAAPNEIRGYVIDSGEPEPPTPPPLILGQTKPLPEGMREASPAPGPLLPAIGSPARLERVSAPVTPPAVNLGEPRSIDGAIQIIRLTGTSLEFVDSTRTANPLPAANTTRVLWLDRNVLLAGEARLALFDPISAQKLWSRDIADIRAVVPLPAGVLVQSGAHHLVAIHRDTGATAWVLNGRNEHRELAHSIETLPRFIRIECLGDRILAQRSNGTRWIVDAREGRRINESPTADRTWFGPPVPLEGDTFVVVDGPNRIARVRIDGRSVWSRELGHESSLTGEPAAVRRLDDRLYVVVRRNHGCEIESLATHDGAISWTAPAFLADADFETESLAVDRQFLFAASADRLFAFKRDTGRVAWSRPLEPTARWRVAVARDRLVVHPAEAIAPEPADPLRSFARFPHSRRIVGLLGTVWDDAVDRVVPIRLVDPHTGDVQQRLEINAAGAVAVRHDAAGVHVAAGGTIYRLSR